MLSQWRNDIRYTVSVTVVPTRDTAGISKSLRDSGHWDARLWSWDKWIFEQHINFSESVVVQSVGRLSEE